MEEEIARSLLGLLARAEEQDSAELAGQVERLARTLDLSETPASSLVELANDLAVSRLVPAALSADFADEVARSLLARMNEAADRGAWYPAYASYVLYRDLPHGDFRFHPPSDELVQCALDELRELATESRFDGRRRVQAEDLLSFLVENCVEGELLEEFERVEHALRESREGFSPEEDL